MPDDSKEQFYHVHTHASGAEYWRHVIEIIAFIVAAGWAFYTFIYQEQIKPGQTFPQAQFKVAVSHQPVNSGAEFVSLSIELRNVGTVPYRPAGYAVAAYGVRYLPRITQTVTKSMRRNVTILARSLAEGPPVLLQSISAMFAPFGANQPTFILSPGGDTTVHYGFGIPRNTYDAIVLKYRHCFVWSNNTRVYNPRPYRDRTGAYWFAFFTLNVAAAQSEHIACGQNSRDVFPL